jgi:hypothetical protein
LLPKKSSKDDFIIKESNWESPKKRDANTSNISKPLEKEGVVHQSDPKNFEKKEPYTSVAPKEDSKESFTDVSSFIGPNKKVFTTPHILKKGVKQGFIDEANIDDRYQDQGMKKINNKSHHVKSDVVTEEE